MCHWSHKLWSFSCLWPPPLVKELSFTIYHMMESQFPIEFRSTTGPNWARTCSLQTITIMRTAVPVPRDNSGELEPRATIAIGQSGIVCSEGRWKGQKWRIDMRNHRSKPFGVPCKLDPWCNLLPSALSKSKSKYIFKYINVVCWPSDVVVRLEQPLSAQIHLALWAGQRWSRTHFQLWTHTCTYFWLIVIPTHSNLSCCHCIASSHERARYTSNHKNLGSETWNHHILAKLLT